MVAKMGGGYEGMGEEVRGLRSTNGSYRIAMGVKCSTGNGVAKELTCITRGHEQWCGDCVREWGTLGGGGQRGKIRTTVTA